MNNVKNINPSHCFDFTPQANGGESLLLTTTLHMEGPWQEQILTLNCYGQYATIGMSAFTPESLRKLASELENFYAKNNYRG